jgi:hypothetical protein
METVVVTRSGFPAAGADVTAASSRMDTTAADKAQEERRSKFITLARIGAGLDWVKKQS